MYTFWMVVIIWPILICGMPNPKLNSFLYFIIIQIPLRVIAGSGAETGIMKPGEANFRRMDRHGNFPSCRGCRPFANSDLFFCCHEQLGEAGLICKDSWQGQRFITLGRP